MLADLVNVAKKLISEGAWARTPLFVLYTGRVRLLEPESAKLAVMDNARAYLSDPANIPFLLQKVTAIARKKEVLVLYVLLNDGTGLPHEESACALDMGGSSLQYAFSSNMLL